MSRSMVMMYGGPPPRKPHGADCKCPRCVFVRANENKTFEATPMQPCSKCDRHIRVGEFCPWCMAEALKASECQSCKIKDTSIETMARNLKKAEEEWQVMARRLRDAEAQLRVRNKRGKSSGRS